LRLREISGLHADHRIIPVPGANKILAGIAADRGVMCPYIAWRLSSNIPPRR
jgi:chemotaxis signal transduction protein